ncbi:MAG: alpha/beta hydrolase [Pseudomonadota bacterium]|nr:alpha/beta hydrolase [Pseudomonadota bacterium]
MGSVDTRALSFVHRYEAGTEPSGAALLLLHGTGGDENDLLPLGRAVAPGRALLAPRGKVLEGGMARFFRRLAEGVFDEDDVRRRAGELARFITEAGAVHKLGSPVALGFSNGANIAAAILLLHPEALSGAILIRAMAPLREAPPADLGGKPVLLLTGAMDGMAGPGKAALLAGMLESAGAEVSHQIVAAGHGLVEADIEHARRWLERVQ